VEILLLGQPVLLLLGSLLLWVAGESLLGASFTVLVRVEKFMDELFVVLLG